VKKAGIFFVISFLLVIVIIVSVSVESDAGKPADQLRFVESVKAMQADYKAAKSSNNSARIEAVLNDSSEFLSRQFEFEGWVLKVDGIARTMGSEELYLEGSFNGIEMTVRADHPDAQDFFRGLSKGDLVAVGGRVKGEYSFTRTGAVERPEFSVELYEIAKL